MLPAASTSFTSLPASTAFAIAANKHTASAQADGKQEGVVEDDYVAIACSFLFPPQTCQVFFSDRWHAMMPQPADSEAATSRNHPFPVSAILPL